MPSAAPLTVSPIAKRRLRKSVHGHDPDEARDAIDSRDERLERDEEWPLIPPASQSLGDIRTQARRLAEAVRTRALRDAAEFADRMVERTGLRERLERSGVRPFAWMDPLDPDWEGAADGDEAAARDRRFEGEVDVEIGLKDLAALSRIEDAANEIDAVDEVKVERLSGGRATLSFSLDEPIEQMLEELKSHAPCEFQIRSLSDNRLVLDVEPSDDVDADAA